MALFYDPAVNRYTTAAGKPLARQAVSSQVRKLTEHANAEVVKLAKAVESGKITPLDFETQMAALLKAGHIVAAAAGAGGRGRLSAKDWAEVGAKIAWQGRYLAKFTRRIKAKTVSPKMLVFRAKLYTGAFWITYNRFLLRAVRKRK